MTANKTKTILHAAIAATICLLIMAALILLWPKDKTDVMLQDFEPLDNAIVMYIQPEVGYVQSMSTRQEENVLYCDFQSTPGWPTNPNHAKNMFQIPVGHVTQIMFNRPDGDYELVLKSDESGRFHKIDEKIEEAAP